MPKVKLENPKKEQPKRTRYNEPLGLPQGSVRAILALGIVFSGLGYIIVTRTTPADLMTVMAAVIGYYFGSRGVESNGDSKEPSLPESVDL